jgi:hypothetical protein
MDEDDVLLSVHCQNERHTYCRDEACECKKCHFTCGQCGEPCRTIYDGWCAECTREKIRRTPFRGTPCDRCGALGSVRNPRHKRNEYLCPDCHKDSGESLQLPRAGLMASCASKVLEDPDHEFLKVRGNRYRCHRCQQDFFGSAGRINVIGEVKGWR